MIRVNMNSAHAALNDVIPVDPTELANLTGTAQQPMAHQGLTEDALIGALTNARDTTAPAMHAEPAAPGAEI